MGILYIGSHLIFSWQYVRKSFRNALLIKKLNCAFIALCEETIFDLIYGCSDRKEREEEEREELVGGGGGRHKIMSTETSERFFFFTDRTTCWLEYKHSW